ncbi:hypothetical protein [Thermonema rossianum]|uniref:hypothetical protein n=1 Tax=Thermonema rossianum TaxID=55505 RepID=UPI00056E1D94|nr:hypothetical protein [Thermonema rossianum]
MDKRQCFFWLCILLFSLVACQSNEDNGKNSAKELQVMKLAVNRDYIAALSDTIFFEGPVFLFPVRVSNVEGFVFLNASNHLAYLTDRQFRIIQKIAEEGKGPGEVSNPVLAWQLGDSIGVYSLSNSTINYYQLPDFRKGISIKAEANSFGGSITKEPGTSFAWLTSAFDVPGQINRMDLCSGKVVAQIDTLLPHLPESSVAQARMLHCTEDGKVIAIGKAQPFIEVFDAKSARLLYRHDISNWPFFKEVWKDFAPMIKEMEQNPFIGASYVKYTYFDGQRLFVQIPNKQTKEAEKEIKDAYYLVIDMSDISQPRLEGYIQWELPIEEDQKAGAHILMVEHKKKKAYVQGNISHFIYTVDWPF